MIVFFSTINSVSEIKHIQKISILEPSFYLQDYETFIKKKIYDSMFLHKKLNEWKISLVQEIVCMQKSRWFLREKAPVKETGVVNLTRISAEKWAGDSRMTSLYWRGRLIGQGI